MPICLFLWRYKFLIYYIVREICLAVCTRAHPHAAPPPSLPANTFTENDGCWILIGFHVIIFYFQFPKRIYILYSCVVRIRRHSFGGRTAVSQPATASNNSHWINLFAADHSSSQFVCRFNSKMCEPSSNTLMVCVVRTENHVACQRSDSMLKIEILSQNPFFACNLHCCLV